MLCLGRRIGGSIVIATPEGRRIRLQVIDIREYTVRLGIEADREVTIHREEVQRQVDAGQSRRH